MADNAIDKVLAQIEEIMMLSPYPEDMFHSMNTLEWVEKFTPDPDPALRIAALGHDIERGFEDRCVQAASYDTFDEYKLAHALNCAEILVEILEEQGVDQRISDEVARLVANHEIGGDERAELLKDADVLSFFHVCLPLYYDRRGAETTRKRCVWGFAKLTDSLRHHVLEIEYPDPELKELVLDCVAPSGG